MISGAASTASGTASAIFAFSTANFTRRRACSLFPPPPPSRVRRPEPDWGEVHQELQRHKGVTLKLLWLEYRAVQPNGYQYSWFCERYKA